MPPDPNMPWSWVPPEWNLSPVGLSPVYEEPEIVAPPLDVPVPLPEPTRMSAAPAPLEPKLPEADNDTRGAGTEVAPTTAPRRIAADPNVTLEDVLANKRAEYERFAKQNGTPPGRVDAWMAHEEKRLRDVLGARPAGAHITQATGPMGTIGQIGKDETPGTGGLVSLPKEWSEGLTPEEKAQVGLGDPLQVDAISGVDQKPPSDARTSTAVDTRAPGMPEDYLTGEEYGQKLTSLPPEQQEIERAKIEGAKQRFASARVLEASEKAMRTAEDNARTYEQALRTANERSIALDKEAQIIANENPMDRISGGQKLAGVLAAVIGGFAAGANGKNTGLDTVNQIAEQAAQQHAQRLALNARQQGAIGDQVARAGDMNRAAEAVRLATYDSAIKTLESEVQNFDPRGSTALRVMDQINAIKAQRAASLAKFRDDELKRTEGLLKQQREILQLQETQRHNIAGEQTDKTRAYADLLRAKTDQKKADAEIGNDALLTPDELRARGINIPEGANVPAMSLKQAKALAETGRSVEEWNKVAQERVVPGVTVKDKNGKDVPFVALGNAESVEKFRKRSSKLKELVALIDDARRTRTGWTTELGNSQEHQELSTIWGKAQIAAKDYFELGAITKQDEPLIKGVLGTSDPSKLRNPLPGMEKARSLLLKDFRRDLDEHGFPKDQDWDIPDLQKNAPVTTPEQHELNRVLGTRAGASTGSDPSFSETVMSDEQKSIIDKWEQQAASSDELTRKRATDWLHQATQQGGLSSVKSYAEKALGRIVSNVPVTERIGPDTATAHEAAIDQYGLPVGGAR